MAGWPASGAGRSGLQLALTTQVDQLDTGIPQAVDGGTWAGDAAARRTGRNDVLSLLGFLDH